MSKVCQITKLLPAMVETLHVCTPPDMRLKGEGSFVVKLEPIIRNKHRMIARMNAYLRRGVDRLLPVFAECSVHGTLCISSQH